MPCYPYVVFSLHKTRSHLLVLPVFASSLIIAIKRAPTLLVACYSLHLLSILCVCVFHVSELHIEVKFGVSPSPIC
jgi:hypothetical protein